MSQEKNHRSKFNKLELQEVVSIYLSQAHDIAHLFYWMNKNEEDYGPSKKDLFKNGLDALHGKLDNQASLVKKLLQDLTTL